MRIGWTSGKPAARAAVFDNLGGSRFKRWFDLLASGGALVAYGTASRLDDTNNMIVMFVGILARFRGWSLLSNGRRALFYDFWAGRRTRPTAFRQRLAADLRHLLTLLEQGAITPRLAARIPLAEAGRALALAESRTVRGTVVLIP